MKKFICEKCNYIYDPKEHNNVTFENQPEDYKCPICGAEKKSFKEIKEETIEDNNPETQKKHIPVISKSENGKTLIKIGEIDHPMEEIHYITKVQLIKNNKVIETKTLHPNEKNIVEMETIFNTEIEALAYCNLHGIWKSK